MGRHDPPDLLLPVAASVLAVASGVVANVLVDSGNSSIAVAALTIVGTVASFSLIALSYRNWRQTAAANALQVHETTIATRIRRYVTNELRARRASNLQFELTVSLGPDVSESSRDVEHQSARSLASHVFISMLADQPRCTIVVGGPGSGKTTVLLELASRFLANRELEVEMPTSAPRFLPLVARCNSWAGQDDFPTWVETVASDSFGARREAVRAWMNAGKLILLLDGIDAIRTDRRDDFVTALNAWLNCPVGGKVVATCRTRDYMSFGQKLHHDQIAVLQPFSEQQARHFLGDLQKSADVGPLRRGFRKLSDAVAAQAHNVEWRSPLLFNLLADVANLRPRAGHSPESGHTKADAIGDPAAVAVHIGDSFLFQGNADSALQTYLEGSRLGYSSWRSAAGVRAALLLADSGDLTSAVSEIQKSLSADLEESLSLPTRAERDLSRQEAQILELLAGGIKLAAPQIASQLLIPLGDVNATLRSLRDGGLIDVVETSSRTKLFRRTQVEAADPR